MLSQYYPSGTVRAESRGRRDDQDRRQHTVPGQPSSTPYTSRGYPLGRDRSKSRGRDDQDRRQNTVPGQPSSTPYTSRGYPLGRDRSKSRGRDDQDRRQNTVPGQPSSTPHAYRFPGTSQPASRHQVSTADNTYATSRYPTTYQTSAIDRHPLINQGPVTNPYHAEIPYVTTPNPVTNHASSMNTRSVSPTQHGPRAALLDRQNILPRNLTKDLLSSPTARSQPLPTTSTYSIYPPPTRSANNLEAAPSIKANQPLPTTSSYSNDPRRKRSVNNLEAALDIQANYALSTTSSCRNDLRRKRSVNNLEAAPSIQANQPLATLSSYGNNPRRKRSVNNLEAVLGIQANQPLPLSNYDSGRSNPGIVPITSRAGPGRTETVSRSLAFRGMNKPVPLDSQYSDETDDGTKRKRRNCLKDVSFSLSDGPRAQEDAFLDTGAPENAISADFFEQKLKGKTGDLKPEEHCKNFDGSKLEVLGSIAVYFCWRPRQKMIKRNFLVIPNMWPHVVFMEDTITDFHMFEHACPWPDEKVRSFRMFSLPKKSKVESIKATELAAKKEETNRRQAESEARVRAMQREPVQGSAGSSTNSSTAGSSNNSRTTGSSTGRR